MRKKGCDMMVFNRVDTALGGDKTAITLLFTDGGRATLPSMSKKSAAEIILAKIAQNHLGGKNARKQD
jgi:phosphopantothenoylcysteine synthetase/decarboxylase